MGIVFHDGQQSGFGHEVDFVDDQQDGSLRSVEDVQDECVDFVTGAGGLDDKTDEVHFFEGGHRGLNQHAVEGIPCMVNARRVDEHRLTVRTGEDGGDAVAGGLRFGGGDGNLFLNQLVHQSRFAHVGRSCQGDEARSKRGHDHSFRKSCPFFKETGSLPLPREARGIARKKSPTPLPSCLHGSGLYGISCPGFHASLSQRLECILVHVVLSSINAKGPIRQFLEKLSQSFSFVPTRSTCFETSVESSTL